MTRLGGVSVSGVLAAIALAIVGMAGAMASEPQGSDIQRAYTAGFADRFGLDRAAVSTLDDGLQALFFEILPPAWPGGDERCRFDLYLDSVLDLQWPVAGLSASVATLLEPAAKDSPLSGLALADDDLFSVLDRLEPFQTGFYLSTAAEADAGSFSVGNSLTMGEFHRDLVPGIGMVRLVPSACDQVPDPGDGAAFWLQRPGTRDYRELANNVKRAEDFHIFAIPSTMHTAMCGPLKAATAAQWQRRLDEDPALGILGITPEQRANDKYPGC